MRRYTPAMLSKSWAHLYQTPRWQALRLQQLQREPMCKMCLEDEAAGGTGAQFANVVDHIEPHKGDERLFFDANNLQSLCKPHHDGAKRRAERSGNVPGCDASGNPTDPQHHWRISHAAPGGVKNLGVGEN